MNSNPPPLSPAPVRSSESSSKKGCVIGCLAAVIGIPLLLVLIGYFVVMHSSLPLKVFAGAANTADGLSIKGISGSISSGFSVEELRTSDSQGNESVMEGLSLKWDNMTKLQTSRELIIEEIALERAHIFINSTDDDDESDTASSTDSDREGERDQTSVDETELELFEIRKVDIREVVIESTSDDFRLELDEIMMEGFRIEGDDFQLDSLTVGSNFLDLQLEDAEPATIGGQDVPFTRRLVGSVKPTVHESLTREVDFTVDMGAIDGEFVNRILMLDGKVEVLNLGDDNLQQLRVKNFNPADYFSEDSQGLVRDLSLVVTTEKRDPQTGLGRLKAESGTFSVGNIAFVIEPQVLLEEGPEAMEDEFDSMPPIAAMGTKGDLEITAQLHKLDVPPYLGVSLSSVPEREPKELLALVLFDQPFSKLNPAQKAQVESAVTEQVSPSPSKATKP